MSFKVREDFISMILVKVLFGKGFGVTFDKCNLHPVGSHCGDFLNGRRKIITVKSCSTYNTGLFICFTSSDGIE